MIFVAGSNVAECFPVMTNYIWGARDQGAKLIVLDPRETPLARTADVFVPLRPGTDAAFLNGVLHVIERDGLLDEAYIADHTIGWEAVREIVRTYPPERVADICGIEPSLVERVGAMWGSAERAMAFHARGIEHQRLGVENALAVINLVLATGQLGAEGKGYGTITGQGNGQAGASSGQKADQLPGARDIEDPEHRAFIAEYWGIPETDLPHAGISAVELVHAFREGSVRGSLVCATTRSCRCRTSTGSRPTTTHSSSTSSSTSSCPRPPSARTSSCHRRSGRRTPVSPPTPRGRLVLRHRAADPPGEARPDWWILCEIAGRLGQAERFSFDSIEDVFEELRGASAGGIADYSGVTYERLEETGGMFWPVPSEDHPGTPRLFEDGRFFFPDGRARFSPVEWGLRPSQKTTSIRCCSPPGARWRTSCRVTRLVGSARSWSRHRVHG